MPGNQRSAIFSSEHISPSSRDTDEVARSWPQLMALLLQVLQQVQKATADGSVRLTRQQRAALIAEAGEAQKLYAYQVDTTKAWYQARAQDYQREAKAAAARAEAGATPEEQAQSAAYLKGLRASIEHTIHDTALTPEQRGQVVQTLDAIDVNPSKSLAQNLFQPVDGVQAARARAAAAASEQTVAEHRATASASESGTHGGAGDTAQLRRESARQFDQLARRLAALEHKLDEMVARQIAAAVITPDGGSPVSPKVTRARQEAARQAATQFVQPNPHTARAQATANGVNGAAAAEAAEAAVEQAEIAVEQAEQPIPRPEQAAATFEAQATEQTAAAAEAVHSAQMQAEA